MASCQSCTPCSWQEIPALHGFASGRFGGQHVRESFSFLKIKMIKLKLYNKFTVGCATAGRVGVVGDGITLNQQVGTGFRAFRVPSIVHIADNFLWKIESNFLNILTYNSGIQMLQKMCQFGLNGWWFLKQCVDQWFCAAVCCSRVGDKW